MDSASYSRSCPRANRPSGRPWYAFTFAACPPPTLTLPHEGGRGRFLSPPPSWGRVGWGAVEVQFNGNAIAPGSRKRAPLSSPLQGDFGTLVSLVAAVRLVAWSRIRSRTLDNRPAN